MSDTIIAALIAAVVAVLTNLISNYFAASKTNALITYRLMELEKKMDKHNSVIERTLVLEKGMESVNKQIDEIKDDLHHLKEA